MPPPCKENYRPGCESHLRQPQMSWLPCTTFQKGCYRFATPWPVTHEHKRYG
ncbi:hypothetical protein AAVH_38339, partial [Aphelenchoides avenae]